MIAVGAMEIETSAPSPGLGRVTLKEEAGDRSVPILMLRSQVEAIQQAAQETTIPRTHDLLRTAVEGLGGLIVSVAITAVREGTFHAELELKQGERTFRIPARPSDAIALAVRVPGTPIIVNETVFEELERSFDQPNTIRLVCPYCRGGGTFTVAADDEGVRVRQYGGHEDFRLPGVVQWVCFSCGHEHHSRVEAPPWTRS